MVVSFQTIAASKIVNTKWSLQRTNFYSYTVYYVLTFKPYYVPNIARTTDWMYVNTSFVLTKLETASI